MAIIKRMINNLRNSYKMIGNKSMMEDMTNILDLIAFIPK